MKLICKTTGGFQSQLDCAGSGVLPPLCFSSSLILFDVTAFGSKQAKHIQLQKSSLNGKSDSWFFEFGKPILLAVKSAMPSSPSTIEESQFKDLIEPDIRAPVSVHDFSESIEKMRLTTPRQLEKILDEESVETIEFDTSIIDIWPHKGLIENSKSKVGIQITVCPPKAPSHVESPFEIPIIPNEDLFDGSESNAMLYRESRDKIRDKKIGSRKLSNVTVNKSVAQPFSPFSPDSVTDRVTEKLALDLTPFEKMLFSKPDPEVTWLLPCKIKEGISNRIGTESILDKAQISTSEHTIYLKLVTPFRLPSFRIISPEGGQINYGKIAVCQKHVCSIKIKNVSGKTIALKIRGLNTNGPFYLAKAVRPFKHGEICQINVGFKPDSETRFFSMLEIFEGSTVEQIKLIAEGIIPTIELDNTSKELNFGNIVVGDTASKGFKIKNTSTISIECIISMFHSELAAINSLSSYGTQNSTGKNPFSTSILRTKIYPGATTDVIVRFSPDRPSDLFFDKIDILFPGQKDQTSIYVSGRAWGTTLCVTGYKAHPESYRESECVGGLHAAIQIEATMAKLYNSKSIDEANLDDEMLSKLFLSTTNRREVFFVTFDMRWIKVKASSLGYPDCDEDTAYWRIECQDIVLANMKPLSLKLDGKKYDGEFTIEEYSGTFVYDNFVHDYVFKPLKDSGFNKNAVRFLLDVNKGNIEYGGTRSLKVTALDQIRSFYEGCISASEKYDTKVSKKYSMNDFAKNKVMLDWSSIKNNDPMNVFIPLPDKEAEYYRQKMQQKELLEPIYVETVYKINMKGGYRFLEPKGLQLENESQTFFVKIRADPANVQ